VGVDTTIAANLDGGPEAVLIVPMGQLLILDQKST